MHCYALELQFIISTGRSVFVTSLLTDICLM